MAATLARLVLWCPAVLGLAARRVPRGGASTPQFEATEDETTEAMSEVFESVFVALGGSQAKAREAVRLAKLEQSIEDYNAAQQASGAFHRALLALPLTEKFDPPPGSPGHGKLQFSDKVSMPRDAGNELTRRRLEVPWQFEVVAPRPRTVEELEEALGAPLEFRRQPLDKAYCSPLDFRAPPNYIFMPLWMMHQLRIAPFDPVLLTWVRLKNGANIKLVPHQDAFLKLHNPRAILEAELKYYSAATKGATLSLVYNGRQFDLDVADCVGTPPFVYQPEHCDGVSIQDADVSLDLAPVGLDARPRKQVPQATDAASEEDDEVE